MESLYSPSFKQCVAAFRLFKMAAAPSTKLKKIETLLLFLDKKMQIRDQIYPIESYISEKQGEYFVYNLQVQCS